MPATEHHFLLQLGYSVEVLEMDRADIGDDTYLWLDDSTEVGNLAGMIGSQLEDRETVSRLQAP